MNEGTKQLPSNVNTSLKDVKLYLYTTKREIENLLIVNYIEMERTMNNILQVSGKIVTEQLAEYSRAVSLTNLNDIVTGLNNTKTELKKMDSATHQLRTLAGNLDNGIIDFIFCNREHVSIVFHLEN